jgi:hypothetical protein
MQIIFRLHPKLLSTGDEGPLGIFQDTVADWIRFFLKIGIMGFNGILMDYPLVI